MSSFDSSTPDSEGRSRAEWVPVVPDHLAGATILIVDDAEANRRLLERMVGGPGGATVHTLADPRETVSECRRLDPDLLMLDLHMPEMDGVDVINALREQLRDTAFLPIIVLTADVTSAAKERALAAGANDFLTKPFDHVEVLLRVGNLLETRTHFDDLMVRNQSITMRLARHTAQEDITEEMHRQRLARIAEAFEPAALHMVFQPIFDLAAERPVGVEALARFDLEPQQSPDQWFAEATELGEGVRLELHAVAAALAALPDVEPDQFLALNVSPMTVVSADLGQTLAGLPGERLVLELTEHVDFEDYPDLMEHLAELRSNGVRIAMDDTGTGYAGLQHLLQIKPEIIKLDRNLITDIRSDPARRALATSLLAFADEIGATIIAEGIETAEDLETLRAIGLPWGQGYHLARPGPLPSS